MTPSSVTKVDSTSLRIGGCFWSRLPIVALPTPAGGETHRRPAS
jgi:hypothetical protein